MDTKSITAILIGLMVSGLILVAFVPIFTEVTATEDTFTNEGYYRLNHYDSTTDHTVTWTYENPNVMTVDDVDVTINGAPNLQITVIADTNWLVRMIFDSQSKVSAIGYLYSSSGVKLANVSDSQTASFTMTGGTVTIACGTYSGSNTYTDVYLPDTDGSLTMKMPTTDAYINGDSAIVGFGLTRINTANGIQSSPGSGFEFIGTYDDGINGRVWRGDNVTLDDITINAREIASHIDLYRFTEINAVAICTETVDDATVTTDTNVTYNYVIVPYEVTAEKSVHGDEVFNTVIDLIPLLAGVGLLMAGVYYFISRK